MNDTLLRRTLRVNVPVTLLWGAAALLGAPWLDEMLGAPALAIASFGLVALAAGLLFRVFAGRSQLHAGEGFLAGIGDAIFGLTLLVLAATVNLTALGRWAAELSGLATLGMGVLELVGARGLRGGRAAASVGNRS